MKHVALGLITSVVVWLGLSGLRGNGDMVAYLAEVLYIDQPSPRIEDFAEIHATIWAACRDVLTDRQYRELSEGTKARAIRSWPETGPKLLWEDYYQRHFAGRIAYNYANWLAWKAGVPLGLAPYTTSAVCAGLCLLPIAVLAGGGWWGIAVAVVCCLAWRPDLVIGNTASPDAMASLLALCAVAWRDRWWSMVFLFLAPLARPDMTLFSVSMAWFLRVPVPVRIITSLWSAGIYVAVQRVFPAPTWTEWFWTAMLPSFGMAAPRGELPAIDWIWYGELLWRRLPVLWHDGSLRMAMGLAVAALVLHRPHRLLLLGLPLVYIVGHFVLYPVAFERFFPWCYILVTCAVLGTKGLTRLPSGFDGGRSRSPSPSPLARKRVKRKGRP